MENPFFAGPAHESFAVGDGVPGALLIHGFMGTPAELRPLANRLAATGLTVHAPLLPGFGRHVADLPHQTHADWLTATRRAWTAQRRFHEPSILVGFSMGGALALQLAAEVHPELLVLVAPFTRFAQTTANWAMPLMAALGLKFRPFAKADFSDEAVQADLSRIAPGIDLSDPATAQLLRDEVAIPTRTLEQLRRLGRAAAKAAPAVRCPTLVLQGTEDDTVLPADTRRMLSHIGGPLKYIELPAGHDIIQQPAAHAALRDYIQEQLPDTVMA